MSNAQNQVCLLYSAYLSPKRRSRFFSSNRFHTRMKPSQGTVDTQATKLLNQAKDIRQRMLGPEHSEVLQLLILLGRTYQEQKLLDRAAEQFEQVLQTDHRALGPERDGVPSPWAQSCQGGRSSGRMAVGRASSYRA